MASTSRRGLKVSDQNVKASTISQNSINPTIQKSLPAILSRKRKSDQMEMVISIMFSDHTAMYNVPKQGKYI
jgi:hypothetical protein